MSEPRSPTADQPSATPPVHAFERVAGWAEAWRDSGRIVLLLDFDGTLAPIVERPELAQMPAGTRTALESLLSRRGVEAAVVSGRGMADARERAAIGGIAYAGNHGMEIEGPGVSQIHSEAAAARPHLADALQRITGRIEEIPGALAEDKHLTLSIHYRQVPRERVEEVRRIVRETVADLPELRVTEGKEVLEVRPDVQWDKGRAVEFLLSHLAPPAGAPLLYIGDDTTDEDAFQALREWGGGGEGIIVADPLPQGTAARSFVRDPAEVAALLERLAAAAP